MTVARRRFVAAAGALVAMMAMAPGSAMATNVFAGENGTIAFVDDRDGFSDIVTVQPDGSGRVNLTSNRPPTGPAFGTRDGFPSWSPDGAKIAFGRDPSGNDPSGNPIAADIFTMNPDGSEQTQLTNGANVWEHEPTYSLNGARIAFTQGTDGDIRVMNADGSGIAPVTSGPQFDYSPSFSPLDNNVMLFIRDATINRVNADGSSLTPLRTSNFNSFASYSPDGSRIVFSSRITAGGDEQVYVMNADGTNVVQLTTGAFRDLQPTFSPDGTRIAFSRVEGDNGRIAMIPATGGDVTYITEGPYDFAPAWQALNDPVFEVASGIRAPANHKSVIVPIVAGPEPFDFEALGNLTFKFDGNRAQLASKKVNLKPARGSVAAGQTVQAKLTVPKKGQKLIEQAFDAGSKVRGKVTVTATDSLGASTVETSGFRLKPKN